MLTGSRSNVHPTYYEGPAHAEGTPEDPQRDATTLPLIRAAIAIGLPVLAICRGFQELNVAMGGSLDQRIQDLPGRIDHSTPSDQQLPGVRVGKAHAVRLAPEAQLARVWAAAGVAFQAAAVPVNSLHNQGISRLAPRLIAEAFSFPSDISPERRFTKRQSRLPPNCSADKMNGSFTASSCVNRWMSCGLIVISSWSLPSYCGRGQM